MSQQHIIGISGAFGSGKSTAADILQKLGYHKISLSQFLEEELVSQGEKDISRKSLQDLGNAWREEFGSSVLVDKALSLAAKNNWDKVVIDGFRNSEEVMRLRQEHTLLLALVVNRKTRFTRLKDLKRREDLTKELFDELDNRDLGIGEKDSGLQTAICIAMADVFIENNGSVSDLEAKLTSLIKNYE
jgi:dephospho-CoA kinase